MADNLLALQVQPPASLGPALSAVTNLQLQRTQLARQNALYGALASGDSNAVAQWDPSMAQAMVGYQSANRAFQGWKEFGAGAAAGDPEAFAKLQAYDPKSAEALVNIQKSKTDIFSTLSTTQRENVAAYGPQFGSSLLAFAGESDPGKRAEMLPSIKEAAIRAGVKPEDFDKEAELAGQPGGLDKIAAIGRGYLALGTTAQQELGKGAFGVTQGEPGKPQSVPGPSQAAQGLPLQDNALAPPPPTATPANLLAAQTPGGAMPPPNALAPPVVAPVVASVAEPVPAPAAGPAALPPDLQAKYDERAKTLANYGLDPKFVQQQFDDYREYLLNGAPKVAPVPAGASPAAVVPPVAPVAAPVVAPAVAPAAVASPVPVPAVAPGASPSAVLGLPATRVPGSSTLVTQGGPAYEATQKATADDLVNTASMPNQTKQRDLQVQTTALLTLLKDPHLTTGAGAGDFLAINKVKQTFLGILGQHDPQLDADITSVESFGKFATLAAAAVAKQDVGSRVTNFDLQTFLANQPGIGTSLQGNQRLLGIVDQVNSRNMEISRLAQDTVRNRGDWGNWVDKVNTYQSAHPIVDPETGSVLTTSPNGTFQRGKPVPVSKDDVASGVLDDTFHLLPGAQISVDGTTYLYQGAKTGRPGVTGAAAGTR